MSRARATALALVNWKGVFYERYLLDRHVTALEGENGAGKTTVMIAAYVVLLPDLSRLRFTNLGETAATGGDRGIWGRLGDPGRPSYAAMEIHLPNGEHLVAGVHLERKTEPSLELKPFVVTGLTLEGSLKDVLLRDAGDDHEVPELHEVRAAVERRGGTMHLCASAKEYFGALFERGVLPLRLSTEEERTKMHDMLRTSMTGGISRALTSELRAFLLKEESGLADTVTRMRANLDACRRTRAEVAEARGLERELAGVFESARAMFRSAVTAARQDRERVRRTERAAAEEHAAAVREIADLDEAIHARGKRRAELQSAIDAARAFVAEAAERRARAEAAQALVERIARRRSEAEHATSVADEAQTARARAEARRAEATAARDRVRDALERAARGLGDRQAGLDEIHRRAHAHRRAVARLEEARRWLDDPALDAGALTERMARLREELSELDERRAERERRDALRRVHEEDRARAEAARGRLEEILADDAPAPSLGARDDEPHAHARRLLTRFEELRALGNRRDELSKDAERAAAFAKHAKDVRARAEALGLDREGSLSSAGVERETTRSEERGRALDRKLVEWRRDVHDALSAAATARDEAERFEREGDGWSALAAAANRLEASIGASVKTIADVARTRSRLADERERQVAEIAAHAKARDAFVVQAEGFEAAAGMPHDLLTLRDALDAELLASRFENASLDEARWFEAALGPLAHALVVPDPAAAAEALAERTDVPDTVWFVAEDDVARVRERVEAHPRGEGTIDVVVRDVAALRISRVPEIPSIGRAARQRQATLLREKAAAEEQAIGLLRDALDRTDRAVADADRLLLEAVRFDAGDPTERAAAARTTEHAAAERAAETERSIAEATRSLEEERRRFDELRALLPHAHLLDAPELEARERVAVAQSERAERAARIVERGQADHDVLAGLLDALRHRTTDDDASDDVRGALDERRDRVARALDAIRDVLEEPEALTYVDDGRALAETNAVGAALEAQLEGAKTDAAAADAALREAETAWEETVRTWQAADAIRATTCAEHEHLVRELDAVGGSDAAGEDLLRLDDRIASAHRDGDAAEAQLVELRAEEAVDVERQRHAEARRQEAEAWIERAKQAAAPVEAAWLALEREAAERGMTLDAWISGADGSNADGTEARAHARAERAVLVDRLAKARGGADTEARIRAAFEEAVDEPCAFLHAWLAAREWTARRLPVPLEANGDPGDALDKLRTDLASLEGRIGIHETQLRGTSEDVARGIDVHLRKTAARVRRLNQELASLGFGNVSAIRIQIRRVERMDLVLSALRGGEMQELLFQSNLPFEEALAEIFRRYGGGSRSGASRLLDYREYLELVVEIQRRGGTDWEAASPTRLSTGEAIGVGAALMMVILTEWERDANLLRSDRGTGTLRFLFLDEANRLSGDNLAVLFDLCRTLDLQLLVAAPEVARAHGNTTYRLVRRVDEAGREEVIVSGRRTVRDPDASTNGATIEPAPAS